MRPPSYSEVREERRNYICKYTGLTGIEADHILEALYERNIDPTVIDWEQAVSSAREYGDRYEAVWKYLREMYGITPPWTYSRIKEYEERYLPAEIEFNAEQFRTHLRENNHGFFKKVMDALCLGRGEVPKEIEEILPYKEDKKKRNEFIKFLCSGYEDVSQKYLYEQPECITQVYKPPSYLFIMPKREDYKKVWGADDIRKARELAREVGIDEKYAGVWTQAEKNKMKELAEAAGITGPNGKFARCITRSGGKVIIDPDCLRQAAESAGLDDSYRGIWD